MTCNFRRDKDGTLMIVCTRDSVGPSEMQKLKRAMACRRWEICDKCKSYETCKRVLANRKGGDT
jgi:hypothetical protein